MGSVEQKRGTESESGSLPSELDMLAIRAKGGDKAAAGVLLQKLLPMIRWHALRFARTSAERDDLVSAIQEDLLAKAIPRYQAHRGAFMSFANYFIREALRGEARVITSDIYDTRKYRSGQRLVKSVVTELHEELGRSPTDAEVCDAAHKRTEKTLMRMTVRSIALQRAASASLRSLHSTVRHTEKLQVIDTIDNGDPSPEDLVILRNFGEVMQKCIPEINAVIDEYRNAVRFVLQRRIAIDGGEQWSLARCGEHVGVTKERIRQIEGGFVRRLRVRLRLQTTEQVLDVLEYLRDSQASR